MNKSTVTGCSAVEKGKRYFIPLQHSDAQENNITQYLLKCVYAYTTRYKRKTKILSYCNKQLKKHR